VTSGDGPTYVAGPLTLSGLKRTVAIAGRAYRQSIM
jgi:hypothetical protein